VCSSDLSLTFADAQATAAAAKYVQGQLNETDLVSLYGVVDIATRALRAGSGNPQAFLTRQILLFDGILNDMANDLETMLFGAGNNLLGTKSSVANDSPATGYFRVTLTNAGDAKNFEVGMPCEVSTAAAGTSPTGDGSTYLIVSGVNFAAGTVDFLDNHNSDTGYTAVNGSHIYFFGLGNGDASMKIYGLGSWCPTTAPSSTLLNINRALNVTKLGGNRVTGDLGAIENSIFDALNATKDCAGMHGDKCYVNSVLWGLLAKEMGQSVYRNPQDGKGGVGALTILGPDGPCQIISAPKCPANTAWVVDLNSFKLMSSGPTIGILDDDGQVVVRRDASDALEVRAVSFSQLICSNPSLNCAIAFS
jgi:hypothetical protein